MSAFTDLQLYNGLATPVQVLFKATALIDGHWTWYYAPSATTPIGYHMLRSKTTFPKDPNGVRREEFRIRIPYFEAPAGEAPRSPYFLEVDVQFKISGRSTAQERKDLLAYAKNFLASTRASEIVVDGDPPR